MHIISIKMLRDFWQKHASAKTALREWHSIVEHVEFTDFSHLRAFFNSADYAAPYTIFNVGGNKYRLVTVIKYQSKRVFVRQVMTHKEYDEWSKLYQRGKN